MLKRHRKHSGLKLVNVCGPASLPSKTAVPVGLPIAWFVGPKAENEDVLSDLVARALLWQQQDRKSFFPEDPPVITPDDKKDPAYVAAVGNMRLNMDGLLRYFSRTATPFFSLRYQAHMLWDNTLPALAGYFAAMLHNPNNVTIQASTSTTWLEMEVMADLCHMVGWNTEDSPINAWAHITSDGSIANIEALWSAREVKFLPFAVRTALTNGKEPQLAPALDVKVTLTTGTTKVLRTASDWDLFNIRRDEILSLPWRIFELIDADAGTGNKISIDKVWETLVKYDVNTQGICGMQYAMKHVGGAPVILTPSTRHYSWPKAAATNGFGTAGDVTVMVDSEGRMQMGDTKDPYLPGAEEALAAKLQYHLDNQIPIMMVVSVAGSTEESAMDPLTKILEMRDQFRAKGLEFDVHVDAAWGGYMISMVRKAFGWGPSDLTKPFIEDVGKVPLSAYAIEQFEAIRHADSVTIDPHKSGYVQYPAGSILYRNGLVTNLTTFTGAYIGSASEPTVGLFGLEGSRPGAAASAVYFSHLCIRPNVDGYGRILDYALANARHFYARLLFAGEGSKYFRCVPLARLPSERTGGDVQKELALIKISILGKTTAQILADPTAMAEFKEIGPDQNIVDYGFVAVGDDGKPDPNPDNYNLLVQKIYDAFHIHWQEDGDDRGEVTEDIRKYRLFLSFTTFDREEYGDAFMDAFAKRLGLSGKPDKLNCLRSTVMDPYVCDTTVGDMYARMVAELTAKVEDIIRRENR